MKYVYLALLLIFSTLHLISSWKDDDKRGMTKPFLLPLIILYYLSSTSNPSWILIVALATSWLGDVLLIPKGNKWFMAGGISFLICHFMFIGVYLMSIDMSQVKWSIVVPAGALYYSIVIFIITRLIPTTPKQMIPPMCMYLLANSTMNVFALKQLTSNPCSGAIIAYIGAVFFFISDCTLYLVRYYRKPEIVFKKHFTVMLTYIVGEWMITQGVIMLGL